MQGLLWRLHGLAHGVQELTRATLWIGVLTGGACLIGAVATGFLLFEAYGAIRFSLGPEFAGLILGTALMVIAAGLLVFSRRATDGSRSRIGEVLPSDAGEAVSAPAVWPGQADQLAMAAFVQRLYLSDQEGGRG